MTMRIPRCSERVEITLIRCRKTSLLLYKTIPVVLTGNIAKFRWIVDNLGKLLRYDKFSDRRQVVEPELFDYIERLLCLMLAKKFNFIILMIKLPRIVEIVYCT